MAQKRINFESVVSFRLSYNEKEELETLIRKLDTNKSDFFRKQTQQFIIGKQN
ncbi:MAG: hypothetical protein HN778_17200 [Prolixibacteraceae bacterium]|jgi:hypothetical protein|nr:hypothetical protein [Prolixibacteraceae bacterium]MBT6004317.1 hypothetical protein [Prolixibacteraceae bacterium]MBT6765098.1 hypothetical protein [Prolixibacteraceae bacterium]MBT6999872.1 hypothetical protein [Prolixibacteraceae bacterium]MBT7396567.1 hypothetical protein [Prolixibacteraceae bacterium]